MTKDATWLAAVHQDWDIYQYPQLQVLAPLSDELLTLRATSHTRLICGLHRRSAYTRWFYVALGEGDDVCG